MSQIENRAQKIAKILKSLRTQVGYTQKELAEKIGTKQQTYAGYESGRHEPSIDILIQIANLFDVSMDFITARGIDMKDGDAIERAYEDHERLKIATMNNILELLDQRQQDEWIKKSIKQQSKKEEK